KKLARTARLERKAQRRSVRNFTSSFYRGFIGAVNYRYTEARRTQSESTALVLVRSAEESSAHAAELHPDSYRRPYRKLKNRVNTAARRQGWTHGNAVSLSPA